MNIPGDAQTFDVLRHEVDIDSHHHSREKDGCHLGEEPVDKRWAIHHTGAVNSNKKKVVNSSTSIANSTGKTKVLQLPSAINVNFGWGPIESKSKVNKGKPRSR